MKSIKFDFIFFSVISIILLGNVALGQTDIASVNTNPDGFRAAVVKVNITPQDPQRLSGYNPRQSVGILDSLYHRIILMDDGKKQFLLISTEVVGFSPAFYDVVAAKIHDQTGIDPVHIWWAAVHTHSAPVVAPEFGSIQFPIMKKRRELASQYKNDPHYTVMLEQKLLRGIREAITKLSPARLGVGWGISQANINRRAIDADGKASLGIF